MTPTQNLHVGLGLYLVVAAILLVIFVATYNGPVLDEPGAPPTTQVAP